MSDAIRNGSSLPTSNVGVNHGSGVAQAQRTPKIAEIRNADYILGVCSDIAVVANMTIHRNPETQ